MNEAGFQVAVSRVLRMGVTASAVLIAAGFLGSLLVGWDGSLRGLTSDGGAPTSFAQLGRRLLELRPIAITQLGLLTLIATPVVRVVVSVVEFARERDLPYVAMTLTVLGVLLVSLLLVR